jgi:hypothetical protein
MTDEVNDQEHSLDGQYDNAEMAGAQLVESAKIVGLTEVAIPIMDRNAVWAITAKKLGIKPDNPDSDFVREEKDPTPQSEQP